MKEEHNPNYFIPDYGGGKLSDRRLEEREGDIYEQFALIPDEKTHMVIRSRVTRKLANGHSLYSEVEHAPVVGEYVIGVLTDKRKGQNKRKAVIELRFIPCEIKCPVNLSKKGYPPSLRLTCIWAKEKGDVPNPISWRLLTTHEVKNFEKYSTNRLLVYNKMVYRTSI